MVIAPKNRSWRDHDGGLGRGFRGSGDSVSGAFLLPGSPCGDSVKKGDFGSGGFSSPVE
jgi:hypothetical protein